MRTAVYYVQTKNKKGIKNYGKEYPTKGDAKKKFDALESKKQWARIIEYYGMFPVVVEQSSRALLEMTIMLRDNYNNDPKHQTGIDACNKHIAELEAKLK